MLFLIVLKNLDMHTHMYLSIRDKYKISIIDLNLLTTHVLDIHDIDIILHPKGRCTNPIYIAGYVHQ